MLLLALLAACSREPVQLSSYEWVDPAAVKAPIPLFPGATLLTGQTDLFRRARRLSVPEGAAPQNVVLVLYEVNAPLAAVEAYYTGAIGATSDAPPSIKRSNGDFAADEVSLVPILTKLNLPHSRGVATGSYRSVVISGGPGRPTVSLQRPYRDFVLDRIVDRTSILISD